MALQTQGHGWGQGLLLIQHCQRLLWEVHTSQRQPRDNAPASQEPQKPPSFWNPCEEEPPEPHPAPGVDGFLLSVSQIDFGLGGPSASAVRPEVWGGGGVGFAEAR